MSDANLPPTGQVHGADRWFTLSVREYAAKALVTGVVGVLVLFGAFYALSKLNLRPTEVAMSAGGMSVKLERQLSNGVEYFMAVSPQVGWQDTDIEIKPTDDVEFWASGQVNLSLYRVNESVQMRRQIEVSINCQPGQVEGQACGDPRARALAERMARDSSVAPEDLYSPEEYERIRPRQPWLGPRGDTAIVDRSVRARTYRKLAPREPYGRLIGIILPKAEDPAADNARLAFGIGRSLESRANSRTEFAKQSGDLWLAVNDVWNGTGKRTGSDYPENLFLLDNIGFFWVRIRVIHR